MVQEPSKDDDQSKVIRPVAIKATQHHPSMFKDKFENECEKLGASQQSAINAIIQSTEWHRRWVLQEERGHTMPHDTCPWPSEIDNFRSGAKNPSLSSEENSPNTDEQPKALSIGSIPIIRPIALRPHNATSTAPSSIDTPFKVELPNRVEQSPLTLPSESHGPIIYDDASFNSSIPSVIIPMANPILENAKDSLLHALAITGGDVTSKAFEKALVPLVHYYEEAGWDARDPEGIYSHHEYTRRVEGMWLCLSKPTYFGNLGETSNGDPMYTLGRMAFDMFLPTQLVCSLQGNFNPVNIVPSNARADTIENCPKKLKDEILSGSAVLREYNIVTAFTIEPHLADFPNAPNKHVRRAIKGIMTTYGYVLPDPTTPNRLSIWFTGGRIEPNNNVHDEREWNRLFKRDHPGRVLSERIRLLAASLLMGAEAPTKLNDDGSMSFEFTRPLGGHGIAYLDVIYLDNTLRIVRGHRGTIFAFVRVPGQRI
mmetsp:Transcript_2995/g.4531  ORF Transcript_2995/g.4531 Transcript_2995/m.4531 type:complete len:484 (+) Transcript_2995:92-1543(+)